MKRKKKLKLDLNLKFLFCGLNFEGKVVNLFFDQLKLHLIISNIHFSSLIKSCHQSRFDLEIRYNLNEVKIMKMQSFQALRSSATWIIRWTHRRSKWRDSRRTTYRVASLSNSKSTSPLRKTPLSPLLCLRVCLPFNLHHFNVVYALFNRALNFQNSTSSISFSRSR